MGDLALWNPCEISAAFISACQHDVYLAKCARNRGLAGDCWKFVGHTQELGKFPSNCITLIPRLCMIAMRLAGLDPMIAARRDLPSLGVLLFAFARELADRPSTSPEARHRESRHIDSLPHSWNALQTEDKRGEHMLRDASSSRV